MRVSWNLVTDAGITGYRVHTGMESGEYETVREVPGPSALLDGLLPGMRYYCAVEALGSPWAVGMMSEEISFVASMGLTSALVLRDEFGEVLDGVFGASVDLGMRVVGRPPVEKSFTLKNETTSDVMGIGITIEGDGGSAFEVSSALPSRTLLAANGGFEAGLNFWTASGNVRAQLDYAAIEGGQMVEFNHADSTPNGRLVQSFATLPGATYSVGFEVGTFGFNSSSQSLSVELKGSSTLLSEVVTVTGLGSGITSWTSCSYSFVADSTSTTLMFADVSTTTTSIDLLLDNVRVGRPFGPNPAKAVVAAGETVTFLVAFKPWETGESTARLRIHQAGSPGEGLSLTLSGTGAEPSTTGGFNSWVGRITNGRNLRTDDADDDGFTNLQEFLFGSDPMIGDGALTTNEASGGTLIIRWKERAASSEADYQLKESASMASLWANSSAPVSDDGPPLGDYQPRRADVIIGAGRRFFRVEGAE